MKESEKKAIERCALIYEKALKIGKPEVALNATKLQFEIENEIEKRAEAEERFRQQKEFREAVARAEFEQAIS